VLVHVYFGLVSRLLVVNCKQTKQPDYITLPFMLNTPDSLTFGQQYNAHTNASGRQKLFRRWTVSLELSACYIT